MSLWLWLLPLGQAIGGASWGECCYSDGMLDLACFYVNGKARDISHGQWGPMFRATEESMTRSIVHAELNGARGHRPQLADWESFVKRAVVSEQLSSRLLRPKTVPEETIASFLQEVDRGVHNCTMDVFFTMALPEELFSKTTSKGFARSLCPAWQAFSPPRSSGT